MKVSKLQFVWLIFISRAEVYLDGKTLKLYDPWHPDYQRVALPGSRITNVWPSLAVGLPTCGPPRQPDYQRVVLPHSRIINVWPSVAAGLPTCGPLKDRTAVLYSLLTGHNVTRICMQSIQTSGLNKQP